MSTYNFKSTPSGNTTTPTLSSHGSTSFSIASGITLTNGLDANVSGDTTTVFSGGSITGTGETLFASSGVGVNLSAGTLINNGTITGGTGAVGAAAVVVTGGSSLTNNTGGKIVGGGGLPLNGGVGVDLVSGTFTTTGDVEGGDLGIGAYAVKFDGSSATLQVGAGASFVGNIGNFKAGDVIDITNLSLATVKADYTAPAGLVAARITTGTDGTLTFGEIPAGGLSFVSDGSGGTLITATAACYRRGTKILTDTGERPIESLKVGDRVITLSGEARAIKWLGYRALDCTRYRDPSVVWPIRISAGAVADEMPKRDLWVSPGHCLYLDGVLIQAVKLVNGVTISQVPQPDVEYWHLELENHDIVHADGLASETYLDTGNRTAFVNGGAFAEAFPDFKPKHWSETCVPLVEGGAPLVAVKTRLIERAQALGYAMTDDSQTHVMADGVRIDPVRFAARRLAFFLPANCESIELRCQRFVPAHVYPGSDDVRLLGLCVSRLELDGTEADLEDASRFAAGWHPCESDSGYRWRWAEDRSSLPAGVRHVMLDLACATHRWVRPEAPQEATAGMDGAAWRMTA